jgi:hypothetical protein
MPPVAVHLDAKTQLWIGEVDPGDEPALREDLMLHLGFRQSRGTHQFEKSPL